MALFDFLAEKPGEQGLELVLAYLEAAHRARSPFLLVDGKKGLIPATIHSLHEDSKSFRLLAEVPLAVGKGDNVDFLFFLDGLRLGAMAKVLDPRTEVLALHLPDTVELKERRRVPRARLSAKERAAVTVLQGLAEGIGISGIPENISEGGLRMQVDRALAITTEKRLVLGTTLVPAGQPFPFVRLSHLPRCPPLLELSGKAVYLSFAPTGLVLGLAFDKPSAEVKSALGSFLASRTTSIPSVLPPKARRRSTPEEEPVASEPEAVSTDPQPPPAPEAQAPPEPVAAPKVVDTRAALLRLKKNSRGLVVYTPAGFQAGPLKTFLGESGFGRVSVVERMEDLLDALRQPNLGALFIDWNRDTEEAIELMILLREAYDDLPPVILAVRKVDETLVLAAREAGAAQLMVRPYALDHSFVAMLEGFFLQARPGPVAGG